MEPECSQWWPVPGQEEGTGTEMQEIPAHHRRSCCEGGHHERAVRGGCGVPNLGEIQSPTGQLSFVRPARFIEHPQTPDSVYETLHYR